MLCPYLSGVITNEEHGGGEVREGEVGPTRVQLLFLVIITVSAQHIYGPPPLLAKMLWQLRTHYYLFLLSCSGDLLTAHSFGDKVEI